VTLFQRYDLQGKNKNRPSTPLNDAPDCATCTTNFQVFSDHFRATQSPCLSSKKTSISYFAYSFVQAVFIAKISYLVLFLSVTLGLLFD